MPDVNDAFSGSDALIAVDVQRDFEPGGALAVPAGDEVVPVLAALIREFARRQLTVIASRDWHPADHCSFDGQGGPWPPHCVAGTPGAEFQPDLYVPSGAPIISKASEPDKEAYSGFEGTSLERQLKELDINAVIVAGLTTDYCVKTTALDAHRLGFRVIVVIDAIRAVNANPDDGRSAIKHMQIRGVEFEESREIIRQLPS